MARLRFVLLSSIVVVFLSAFLLRPESREGGVGLVIAVAALAGAALVLWIVARGRLGTWIGFASSLLDVSLVSAALMTFLALDMPYVATNSRVIYPMYLIAIAATALRYDSRVCLVSGITAILQYSGVVLYAALHRHLNTAADVPFAYGFFRWNDQIARLILLASDTVLATMIVQRSRQLLLLSTRDRLTGLYNRGLFEERLQEEGERARRVSRPVAVAMLDLDHFKAFNDTYGHRAGDELLQALARTLRESFRATDIVARYGGEEFAVILTESGLEESVARLEEFRRTVAVMTIPLSGGLSAAAVTISIGVAVWPGEGDTLDKALFVADQRLYEAKRRGRNCVIGPPLAVVEQHLLGEGRGFNA